MIQRPELKLAASRASTAKKSATPTVFTAEVVRRLHIANRSIRLLRDKGIAALGVDITSNCPVVVVDESAAEALRREAYRSGLRCMTDAAGGTVFENECALTWRHKNIIKRT